MAAAALPVAKVIVTQVLPVLYDGYQKRAKIVQTARRCEASMYKAEELLNAPAASSSNSAVQSSVESLSKCVEEMHQYLTKMTQNMPQKKKEGLVVKNLRDLSPKRQLLMTREASALNTDSMALQNSALGNHSPTVCLALLILYIVKIIPCFDRVVV